MKNAISFFVIGIFICTYGYSQTYWGKTTTSNYTNEAIDVESDASGNTYVAGYFSGGTSFEQNIVQVLSQGANDIYVSKYDNNGNFLWVKTFGGIFSDKPTDLVIDHAGNVVLTGQFFGQISFGANTLNAAGNSKDIFLVKLDNSGNVIWAKKEGGTDSENAYGVSVDNQNNIILTGQFKGTSLIAGQTITSLIDPSSNQSNYDLFISKYSPNGLALWLKTGQAKYEERGLSVACDAQDNIFITGQFSDTLIFAGSTINNNAFSVGFVSKLSPSGTFLWLNQMKAGFVVPYDIEINNANEPVIIGDFSGAMLYINPSGNTIINSTYNKKIFVLKISNGGSTIWSTAFSSENDLSARSLSINAAKNIFVTGYFGCSWSQFHTLSTATFNSVGFKDAYLLQIDNLGNFGFAKTFGSKLNDEGQGVAINNQQEPVICGTHTNNLHIPATNSIGNYTVTGSPFGFSYSSSPQNNVSLIGDASANSFLTNAVRGTIPDYNYFYNSPTDSLYGYINSLSADTIDFCNVGFLNYNTLTYSNYGPDYNYTWNTGQTLNQITINQSGMYIVSVERTDQCSAGVDTIIGVEHSTPSMPLLSNSLGVVNSPNYPNYAFCQPDSVTISFSNLCSGCSIQINSVGITDTLPHVYSQANLYTVVITNDFCVNYTNFNIQVDSVLTYDSISPQLVFIEDNDLNDTITTCAETSINIKVYDLITNPLGDLTQIIYEPIAGYNFNVNQPILPMYTSPFHFEFNPVVSGWHVFTYTVSLGYNNLCGLDTTSFQVTDSIYIIINPLPTGNSTITATDLLCPNGSVYLIVNPVYPGLAWTGPNIAYTSANNDSVQVTSAGYYNYSGFLTDSITGCTDFVNNYYQLFEKQPPIVISNPLDGIVCPGDSVTFSVPNNYISYNWVGPDGTNLSNTNSHIDADAGFYYCHLTDSSGCPLTTTPAELNEYTTPSIYTSPQSVICSNNPVYINVTYSGQAQVNWINPSNGGNSPQILVFQPGIYICQINQCGIVTIDSVVITDGSFSVNLTASDSILCFGDTSILVVDPNYSSYNWTPSLNPLNTNEVTTSGYYSVLVTNQYGCEAYSDTIFIDSVPYSFPPIIPDTSVCLGDSILLLTPNATPVDWYNSNLLFESTGTFINLPPLYQDTLVFAAYNVLGCPPAYQDIDVTILLPPTGGMILGDTTVCENATTQLTLNLSQGNVQWYVDSIYVASGSTFYLAGSVNQTIQQVMAIITNHCYSDTLYQNIYTLPATVLALSEDTIILCGNATQTLVSNTSFSTLNWETPFGLFTSNFISVTSAYPNASMVVAQGINSYGCPSNFDSVLIFVPTAPVIDIYSSGIVCLGDSVTLTSNINSDSIVWSGPFGSETGNQVTFPLTVANGIYSLTIEDSIGCIWTDYLSLNSLPLPFINLLDTVICFTDWYQLMNSNPDLVLTNSNGNPIDTLTMTDNAWFTFMASSNSTGCSMIDSIFVQTVSCSNILPNVMTPNGDGINDFFIVEKALLQPNNKLIIVNRWHNVVFEMKGYDNRWDGGELNDGVYFFTYYPNYVNNPISVVRGFIQLTR